MTWVFNHSPFTLGTRLVHLALADVANDDHGNRLWLKRSRVAEKAKLSLASVDRALAELVKEGYLVRITEGGGRGKPSEYRLVMKAPQNDEVSREAETSSSVGGNLLTDARETSSSCDSRLLLTQEELKGNAKALATPSAKGPTLESRQLAGTLCHVLADRITLFRADPTRRPAVAEGWVTEMDRLLRVGPQTWATPHPIAEEQVRRAIDFVFTDGTVPSRTGFCWAKIITTPAKLRDKWDALADDHHQQTVKRNGNGNDPMRGRAKSSLAESLRRAKEYEREHPPVYG